MQKEGYDLRKKRKGKGILACGLMAGLLWAGTLRVFAGEMIPSDSAVDKGKVKIVLKEFRLSDGMEVPWAGVPVVLPGAEISKIPRIYNDGADCRVRVKLTFRGLDTLPADCFYGMDSRWEKASDGYYYYKEVLKTGESTDVFQGLAIPEDLSPTEAGKTFWLDIDVEAAGCGNSDSGDPEDTRWENCLESKTDLQNPVNTGDNRKEEAVMITASILAGSFGGLLVRSRRNLNRQEDSKNHD